MKTIKYAVILLASSFLIFNSCTKDVAGPAGPTGSQGVQGSAASYSVTIDSIAPTGPKGWPGSPNGNGAYTFIINNIKALTNPNSDIIEVYVSNIYNQFSSWQELNAVDVFTTGDALTYTYGTYQVTLAYTFSSAPTQETYVKIVVINQP